MKQRKRFVEKEEPAEENNYKNKLYLKHIIIPIEVFGNKKLSYIDMFLFAFIQLLDGKKGCFASNLYLAGLLNTSESTITNSISKLLKLKYLTKGEFDGRKRVLKIHLDYIKTYRNKNKDPLILRGRLSSSSEADSEKLNKNENPTLYINNKSLNKYILFLEKWNKNKIITHKKITSKKEVAIKKALKDYTQEEIFKAFQNYATVINSTDYFFSYRWTLEDFLQRGLHKFVDEACPLDNKIKTFSKDQSPDQELQTLSPSGFPIITRSYDRKSKFRKTVEEWQTLLETNTNKLLNADIWATNHSPNQITVFNGVVLMQVWLDNVDFSLYGGSNLQNRIKPLHKLIDYYILCISEWWDWMDGVKDNVFDINNKIFKMFIREMEDSFPARIKIKSDGWVNDSDWEPRN